ncbi:MAG: electron transport complex subunit RsxE [Spirochaetes bacterium]|nr:MAG: electron transport complex subunit RsxE [Spirochaetota bacterium]
MGNGGSSGNTSKKDRRVSYEFLKGFWKENPILVMILGMCPTLAVTTTAINGMTMGLAVLFVLTCSSLIVSLVRNIVPKQVRIPTFIVIIATFVTMVDLFLKAFFMDLSKALGPFIPLIVVNCIILGRAEAFASRNPVFISVIDAIGVSLGFTVTLIFLGGIREILGMRTFFGHQVLSSGFEPWVIMLLPPGAFITLGFMLGAKNMIDRRMGKNR